jgi:hypothetical protein
MLGLPGMRVLVEKKAPICQRYGRSGAFLILKIPRPSLQELAGNIFRLKRNGTKDRVLLWVANRVYNNFNPFFEFKSVFKFFHIEYFQFFNGC